MRRFGSRDQIPIRADDNTECTSTTRSREMMSCTGGQQFAPTPLKAFAGLGRFTSRFLFDKLRRNVALHQRIQPVPNTSGDDEQGDFDRIREGVRRARIDANDWSKGSWSECHELT